VFYFNLIESQGSVGKEKGAQRRVGVGSTVLHQQQTGKKLPRLKQGSDFEQSHPGS
jgi:hypothetical protein